MKLRIFTTAIMLCAATTFAQHIPQHVLKPLDPPPAGFEPSVPLTRHPFLTQMTRVNAAASSTNKMAGKGTGVKETRIIGRTYRFVNAQKVFTVFDSSIYTYSGNRGGKNASTNKYDSSIQLAYDEQTASYKNKNIYYATYDANDRITSRTGMKWDANSAKHINDYTYAYTYDGQGNLVNELQKKWDKNTQAWVNYRHYFYGYDANNNKNLSYYQQWNVNTQVWENTYYKYEMVYNNKNLLQKSTSFSWDANTKAWANSSEDTYTYNSDDLVLQVAGITWDDKALAWVNSYKYYYEYTNKLPTKYTLEMWDGNSNQWMNYDKYTYSYSNNLLSEEIIENWDVNKTSWVNTQKTTYTYSPSQKRTVELGKLWEISSQNWVNNTKITYSYDGNDSMLTEMRQSADANDKSKWINDALYSWSYYSNSDLRTDARQSWKNNAWGYFGANDLQYTYYYEEFENTTGINRFNTLSADIALYPNPASQVVNIKLSLKQQSPVTITMLNMSGQRVLDVQLHATTELNYQLNVSILPAGMYQCVISTNHGHKMEIISIVK